MQHKLLHLYLTDEQYDQQQPAECPEWTFQNDMRPNVGATSDYPQNTNKVDLVQFSQKT